MHSGFGELDAEDQYETDAAGAITTSYASGPAGNVASFNGLPISSSTVDYLYYSGHGDLAAEADNSGASTATHTYDPWGAPSDSPSNQTSHRFTGEWNKQYDATTSLVLMGARPYDPTLGRFLAVDPVDGGSANYYDYVNQDPINGYDLEGTSCGVSVSCYANGAKKTVTKVRKAVTETSLELAQIPPYALYPGSYFALKESAKANISLPLPVRAGLIGSEGVGLAGDELINKMRGKSMYDDARRDSVLPNVVTQFWNPQFAITYLPGMRKNGDGSIHRDWSWGK